MKWLSKLFPILFLVSSAYGLTLADLITQSRIFLRDTATDPLRQRFSDSQLTSFINNGQKEMNLRSWAVINSTPISLITGTTEYSLPPDHIVVLRVTVNNSPIQERTFSFLDDSNTNWIADSGTVTDYYLRTDSSVVSGVTKESIGVHPVSTFTATMVVQYLAQPPDLSGGSDIPFAGNNRLYPFHHALAYYTGWRGAMAISNLDEASIYLKEYETMMSLMESITKNRLSFNPSLRGGMTPLMGISPPQPDKQ